MASGIAYASDISTTLQNVTNELLQLQDLLLFAEMLDPGILTDFRDIINRIRHNASAVQQYRVITANEIEPNPSGSIQAGEIIRTVCQLCKLLEDDLDSFERHLQDAQLFGLYHATRELGRRLRELIGN